MEHDLSMIKHLAMVAGIHPQELHRLADEISHPDRTLAEDVAYIENLGIPVARRYPQGRRRILEGDDGYHLVRALPAFGARSRYEFTVPAVQAAAEQVQHLVAARQLGRERQYATTHPQAHGRAAKAQYLCAAAEIGRALADNGLIGRNPMEGLRNPRPERLDPWPKALDDERVVGYADTVLTGRPDTALVWGLWVTLRCTGGRAAEILSADLDSIDVSTGMIALHRKGSRRTVMPITRPVAQLVHDLAASRPAPRGARQALFRRPNGRPVTVKEFEAWSDLLHDRHEWARGHAVRVHLLRHTLAQHLLNAGATVAQVAAFLGHERTAVMGSTGIYLVSADGQDERLTVARRFLAWPDQWPTWMPEWELLDLLRPRWQDAA